MTKIFKQLARHWAVCLVVFSLLFVQAYCDLSLPDYTSRIVDTGIQQGGIESPLPETIRQSTLDALTLLMSEEDADALQNAYGYYLQDDGVLKLRTDLTDDERTALEDAVTTPDIVLYMAAAQAANAPAGQDTMGMTGLADMQAASSESTTTDSETVTPDCRRSGHRMRPVCRYEPDARLHPRSCPAAAGRCFASLDDTLMENLKRPVHAAGAAGIRGAGHCPRCADALPLPRRRPDAGPDFADGGCVHCGGLPRLPCVRRHWPRPAP